MAWLPETCRLLGDALQALHESVPSWNASPRPAPALCERRRQSNTVMRWRRGWKWVLQGMGQVLGMFILEKITLRKTLWRPGGPWCILGPQRAKLGPVGGKGRMTDFSSLK